MIQRIQSVYLALAVISGLLTFFLAFAHFFLDGRMAFHYGLCGSIGFGETEPGYASPLNRLIWILAIISVVLPAFAIFTYKNRPLQYKLARLAFLWNLAYFVGIYFAVSDIAGQVSGAEADLRYWLGFYLPLASAVFCFFAARGIKRDENIVRSLDRIR